ncbi:MAG: hypothetical protein Ct9H90mP16_01490 [Candidatus Poseidoniales archaeon]|nr:MAG: hypothetical protein Ct9H90mP16_01490 [Candidatus Poseidoniales archaeon]
MLEADGRFVPNDVRFDAKGRFLLLTGPNMGGKSTYLRTSPFDFDSAQSGSYVPATKAGNRIGRPCLYSSGGSRRPPSRPFDLHDGDD